MEKLISDQVSIGKEVEKIVSAYHNDAPERKTLTYLNEKLLTIETLIEKFVQNDTELRKYQAENPSHMYFVKDYYNSIRRAYREIVKEINDLIKHIKSDGSGDAAASTGTTSKIQVASHQQASADETITETRSRLIRRFKIAAQALKNIFANTQFTGQCEEYYKVKVESITRYWHQIEDINYNILEQNDDIAETEYNVHEYFQLEIQVQDTLAKLRQNCRNPGNSNEPSNNIQQKQSLVKLPKIVLPKFDGNYLMWQQFHDLFTQMVHNQTMGNAQKMWYLKMNLIGEAEKLIRHLQLSDDNYQTAWNILKNRYENKRLQVTALLDKLMNQPSVQQESASALKILHDTTKECILSLENLGLAVKDHWDPIIMHTIMKKLDRNTHSLFEQSLTSPRDLQSVDKLLNFIETRFQALEALGQKLNSYKPRPSTIKQSVLVTNKTSEKQVECIVCKRNHPIYFCERFLNMSTRDRQKEARNLNLCLNCLRKGHNYSKCTSRGCLKCNKKHNTLLHHTSEQNRNHSQSDTTPQGENKAIKEQPSCLTLQPKEMVEDYIFLATAMANAKDKEGNLIQCRILLDSGSQINLITDRLRRKLKLDNMQSQLNITGLGDSRVKVDGRVNITIQSRTSNYETNIEAYIIKEITEYQPQKYINIDNWEIPNDIILADPNFNKPQKIDILLGAEHYGEIVQNKQLRLKPHLPIMQSTTFGWIMLGKMSNTEYTKQFCGITNADLDKQLRNFWEIEECPQQSIMSITDKRCEEYYEATTIRDSDGRFIVNLPMLSDPRLIGESRQIAFKRLLGIERKLQADAALRKQYAEFIHEYLKLGHMTEISPETLRSPYCFLPHHFVLKPSSSTTKLRVVFDASAKTSNNLSLNDLLLNGPKIQEDLIAIILRFRTKRYVFTADIVKMYRQILVAEEDRKLQLIMWRNHPTEPVKYFQLNTVTYGTKSAPYLAIKCLKKLAEDGAEKYPLGAAAVSDFYVDDVMTGSDDLMEAVQIQNELRALLESAKFELRKWCANHPRLVQNIPNDHLEIKLDFSDLEDNHVKTLGLVWHPITDLFAVTSSMKNSEIISKRTILAEVSQIFDPLGLVNPVVVMAKIFMQQLWQLNLQWDQELPVELHSSWLKFRRELTKLQEIKIPRYMFSDKKTKTIELHAFADASEKAYGTALYLRSKDEQGKVTVKLLCAKSRVAPKKPITLPRLELCAAKLCAQVVDYVKSTIKLKLDDICYWSDSQITISWIHGDPSLLKTFVANRVAAIQDMTQGRKWRYVNTHENPADLVSRGVYPDQLMCSRLWFEGPEFLKYSRQQWPGENTQYVRLEEEEKPLKVALSSVIKEHHHPLHHIDHKNSFRTLQRVMAYVLRATKLVKKGTRINHHNLTVTELEESLMCIIREVQQEGFNEELKALKEKRSVHKSSKLATLTPFLDNYGIIRVGGRLEAADVAYDTKHPIVLPSDHFVTKLLMTHIHISHLHAGPQALHAIARQKYWILQGRNIARSIIANCVRCAKIRPRLGQQQMGNLPSNRVQQARPFLNTGVDFCGPVFTHFKIRGKRPQKTYIAVFCCFATKAIHLEVVSDLTSEGFLGALKRFIARRGRCENIFCDNATNFVGAKNQLEEVKRMLLEDRSTIEDTCLNFNIQFHFNPPRAPHFGGLWEAAVKSTKNLLQRTIASAAITYEEMCTITAEIEAILNSRPLTQMSSDPNDLAPLTPAHFIIGEPMTSTISTHVQQGEKLSLLTRWALVSALRNLFWKRWSQEYLVELQKRSKWLNEYPNLKPGTLVTIKDDNLAPLKWSMGRVIETIKGADNKVRVADVKTSTGVMRRAIHQLAPLPVQLDEEEKLISPRDCANQNDRQNHDDDSRTKPRKRRASTSPTNALKVFLLTALVLPQMSHSQPVTNHNIEIQDLNQNSGIYFENIGTGMLRSDTWNVWAYYDLKGYHTTILSIDQLLKYLKKLYPLIPQNEYYIEIAIQYQHQLQEIRNSDMLLQTHNKLMTGRQKRSPLDIVGTLANRLFGVLDQEYADQMKNTIKRVQANENHLYELVKNQTSVIETTINVVKRSEEDQIKQINEVKQGLDLTLEKLQNMNIEIRRQKAIQSFNTLSILISSLINECRFIQNAIINTITDTHHGRVNPLIITPEQIRSQISIIKEHLPQGTTLLAISNKFDITLTYQLMEVQCNIINNYVIFDIKFPLVSTEHFEIYNLIPVPIQFDNTLVSIAADNEYIMVNIYRDQFYLMNNLELSQCTKITDLYVCDQHHPTLNKVAYDENCEIELFLQRKISPSCTIKASPLKREWRKLDAPNQWLFSFHKEYEVTIVCENELFRKTLKGNGILKMNGRCTLKDNEIVLRSSKIITTRLTSNSFEPKIKLQFNQSHTANEEMTPLHVHVNIVNHTRELESINKEVQKIKFHQTQLQELQPHDIHQFTIGYSTVGILTIVIIYLIIIQCKNKNQTLKIKPIPTTRVLKDEDFSFEVRDFKRGQDVENQERK